MPAEAPPMESQMTDTAKEIKTITESTEVPSALSSMEDAFKQAFPDGVPLSGEIKQIEPKVEQPPPKEEKKIEKIKSPIPEVLLKKPDAPLQETEVEKEIAEQTKGMSPKASERFKAIHSRATVAETKMKQLETELTQLKVAAPKVNGDEVEALKRQVEEYDEIIKQTKLERHPKFKDAFDGEIGRQIKTAKAIVGDKMAKEVAAFLESGGDEKWEELSEKLGPLKSAQVSSISTAIAKLKIDKAEQLENWKENYSKVEEFETKKEQAVLAKSKFVVERAVSGVIASVQDPNKGLEIFKRIDGNEEWNREVDGRIEKIKEFATADLEPDDRATLAMQAVAADKYRHAFYHALQVNALLQEALQKFRSGEPSFEGTDTGKDPSLRANMGFVDSVETMLIEAGAIKK